MRLFKLNTGWREHEICRLCRDEEVPVSEPDTPVFFISGEVVQNRDDRLPVLDWTTRLVIGDDRGS